MRRPTFDDVIVVTLATVLTIGFILAFGLLATTGPLEPDVASWSDYQHAR